MRIWGKIGAAALGTAVLLWAVTVNGSLEVLGTLRANIVDFSAAVSSAPMKVGTTLPTGCEVGQAFFKSDAAAGQNIFLCTAANTWTQVQSGSGGTDGKPDLQYVALRTDFSTSYNLGTPAYFGDFAFFRGAGSQNLNSISVTSDRLGVTRFSTTSTSGNRSFWMATIADPVSDADNLYAKTDKDWELVAIFRYPAAADYANSTAYLGLLQAYGSDNPPRGFGVRYAAGTDTSLTYFATTTANNFGATLASGVAADTNWHKLRIRSDGTQTYKMWISLDGEAEKSICPSGCDLTLAASTSGYFMEAFGLSVTTGEAANKSLDMDYLYFWMNWGTR